MLYNFSLRPRTAVLPVLALSATSLLLAGCGGGSNSSSPASQYVTAATPLSVSAATPSGLTATFAESRSAVPVGGSITYTLTLTNNTTQPITFLAYVSPGVPNGSVNAVGGIVNLQDASGNRFPPLTNLGGVPQVISIGPTTTVAPGQSVSGTYATGNIFTPAGRYTATATFATVPMNTAPPQTTTVGPLAVTAQYGGLTALPKACYTSLVLASLLGEH